MYFAEFGAGGGGMTITSQIVRSLQMETNRFAQKVGFQPVQPTGVLDVATAQNTLRIMFWNLDRLSEEAKAKGATTTAIQIEDKRAQVRVATGGGVGGINAYGYIEKNINDGMNTDIQRLANLLGLPVWYPPAVVPLPPPPAKKPIWPWIAGGVGVLVLGGVLVAAFRR